MANTYGDSGNRWWVGANVGETGGQSTILGKPSVFIDRPNGYESLPSGNANDDRQFAAAAKHNAVSSSPNTISVENIQWYNINGPYATQSLANAAIPVIQKKHPAPGTAAQVLTNNGAGGLVSWEQALSNILANLTSGNLWIRVAKVAIGGTMFVVGVSKLAGLQNSVVNKAIKIAPLL